MPGTTTLKAEVTNVSGHCVWIPVDDEELALPYSGFPWFKSATILQILNVLTPGPLHICIGQILTSTYQSTPCATLKGSLCVTR